MVLGHYVSTLTHGSGSGAASAYLFNRPNSTASSLSGSYTFETEFNGEWGSNIWSALVADQVKGAGAATWNSWGLTITGTAASSGTMDLGPGGVLQAAAAGTTTVGAAVISSAGASAISLATEAGKDLNLTGGLSGTGDFNKTGEGTVRVGNSSDFTGQLNVGAGKVVVDGALGSASTTVVGSGGILGGSGTVGALQVASGGTLAVGNSPGTLNAGNTTWAGGATYAWEIDDFSGNDSDLLSGQGSNWDFLNVAGTLNVTASGASKFIIDVISLLAADNLTEGLATNWDPLKGYSFSIATASGGIQIGGSTFGSYGSQSAFDSALAGLFDIRTTNFDNAPSSANLWSISTSSGGQTLLLNYNGGATAIPEPSSAALALVGLGVLALNRRRCRR
jgi:autotransporter-associated beta strand protein